MDDFIVFNMVLAHANRRQHLLGLVGVEAGDGHDLGGTPRGGGQGGQSLPAKVFTEAFVHCWRNVAKINDP